MLVFLIGIINAMKNLDKMEKKCENVKCKKIIVKDWEKYLEDYPNEVWLQCQYCFHMEKIR